MVDHTRYPDGAPCWADVTTTDRDGAQRFYGGLFGWTFDDQGEQAGHYTICLVNGAPVAALSPPPPGAGSTPPAWTTYLATADLDATAAAADQHGGKLAMSPMDVMQAGRMAYVFDPAGAGFGLWQGRDFPGAALRGEPGTVGWNELVTPDGTAADRFYQAVFGYQAQEQIGDGGFDYTVWKTGDQQVCGRLATADDPPPRWVLYFSVSDTDTLVARVPDLGGQVQRAPWDTPYGRMALISDPWGARFALAGAPDS